MKSIQEARSFFESDIKPRLRELETWRLRKKKKFKLIDNLFRGGLILVIIYILSRFLLYILSDEFTYTGLIIALGWLLVLGFFFLAFYLTVWRKLKYDPDYTARNSEFKHKVIIRLLEFMAPGMVYSPDWKMIDGETFVGSEIFRHTIYYPEGYWAEDFVTGKIGETSVRFFEINGNNIYSKRGKETVDTDETIAFAGFFLIADFNKNFEGHTLVIPESSNKDPNWFNDSGRQLIRMDDPEFERLFKVYGTDPVAVRYVLSTSLMKRITELREKLNMEFFLSFRNNNLYIGIPHADQFEIDINRSFYDVDRIREFYHDLRIGYDIVEELNLNTRIWGSDKTDISRSPLYKYPVKHKPRRKKVYTILSLLCGFLGVHYFYIGYYRRGMLYLIISAVISTFFLYNIVTREGFAATSFTMGYVFCALVWFMIGNVYSLYIKNDSRGVPMI